MARHWMPKGLHIQTEVRLLETCSVPTMSTSLTQVSRPPPKTEPDTFITKSLTKENEIKVLCLWVISSQHILPSQPEERNANKYINPIEIFGHEIPKQAGGNALRARSKLQQRDIRKLPHWRISQSFLRLCARCQALRLSWWQSGSWATPCHSIPSWSRANLTCAWYPATSSKAGSRSPRQPKPQALHC